MIVCWDALEFYNTAKLKIIKERNRKLTLFETTFKNLSPGKQSFNFQAERSTESSLEMSVQSGVTIGQNMKFSMSVKAPGFKMAGILGEQIEWKHNLTETYKKNEKLTWSVNTPVILETGQCARVTLSVVQQEITGVLTIRTKATIVRQNGLLPVYLVSGKDNGVVGSIFMDAETIINHGRPYLMDPVDDSDDSGDDDDDADDDDVDDDDDDGDDNDDDKVRGDDDNDDVKDDGEKYNSDYSDNDGGDSVNSNKTTECIDRSFCFESKSDVKSVICVKQEVKIKFIKSKECENYMQNLNKISNIRAHSDKV